MGKGVRFWRLNSPGVTRVLAGALAGLLALVVLLVLWIGYRHHWQLGDVRFGTLGDFIAMLGLLENREDTLFQAGQGMDREEARLLYANSQSYLLSSRYEEALEGFKTLEKVYPGLLDLILIHQAEACAGLPDEYRAQQALKKLLEKRPGSSLVPMATYQLAQSHLRARETDAARQTFEKVVRDFPESEYALGSLYYLGSLLNEQQEDPKALAAARAYWLDYLERSPDGRFAPEIAQQLEPLLPRPTSQEHRLLGLAYATGQRDWNKALAHLKQAPFAVVWLELATAQLKSGQVKEGLQSLVSGIPLAKDPETLQKGVDMLLRNSGPGASTLLSQIAAKSLPEGGDYVLWQLAQLSSGQADGYYRRIVTEFPRGDYAPESSWQLLWPLLKAGDDSRFLAEGENHLKRYPYANSSSKILFWRGKILEKRGQTREALAAYEEILEKYPISYYAFRAEGRRSALLEGSRDPGWRMLAGSAQGDLPKDYQSDLSVVSALKLPQESPLVSVSRELESIGAADDLSLLLAAELGELPPVVESWREHRRGDRAKGIRIIRDDLARRAREGDLSGLRPSEGELKLLYPLYFSDEVEAEARKNSLDPLLVLSLMREESYFNELAVSSSNALGLMQLLPSTAGEVAHWVGLPSFQSVQLFQPEVNVKLGSRYLGYLHELFQGNSMLSVGAYNGGPNAMKRWVNGSSVLATDPDLFIEQIPYAQTRDYIKKVYGSYWNYSRLYRS